MSTTPRQAPPAHEGNGEAGGVRRAWAGRAAELARWAWDRLVNRTDVWGGYNALADRDKVITRPDGSTYKLGPTTTRPAVRDRGLVVLTAATLERHFRTRAPEHVMGLHTTAPDNTSKCGATEVDWHGPESTDPEVNWRAARAWHDRLRGRGFHPLLTDSNGAGGYHLRLLLTEPVPTARVFWFLRDLVKDYAGLGLPEKPETFPKQSRLEPRKDRKPVYGNWLRVPGLHHTRRHWSRVWDGSEWLDGNDAIDFILALKGDSPSLIPSDIEWQFRVGDYLARLPNLGEGQGRDDVAFNFLAFLVRDLKLADDYALEWAGRWDAGNRPPKGPERLREILANVHRYGQRAYGGGVEGPSGDGREGAGQGERAEDLPRRYTMEELLEAYPTLDPPVIDGVLRLGETANVIAATKIGKSWLSIALAFAVATGRPWLGKFATTPGGVMILDNELRKPTIASRLRTVAEAAGVPYGEVGRRVEIVPLRGKLKSIVSLERLVSSLHPGEFSLIILDAFYRALPAGTDENSNASMAQVYNLIDNYAERLGSAWTNIHHASKGNQSGKGVTDVGSGAGSMSRAADAHLVLREHEESGVAVLEAAVRSFPPVEPFCLRWEFPLFCPAPELDPSKLKDPRSKSDPEADGTSLLLTLDGLDPDRRGLTEAALRKALRWGYDRLKNAIPPLLEKQVIESTPVVSVVGNGGEVTTPGWRRRRLV
jgi:hypothetical protein